MPGQHQAELRAHEPAAELVERDEDPEREVVVAGPLDDLVARRGERRDRRDAVLAAQVVPAAREPISGIGTGQRAEPDEDRARRVAPEQQEPGHHQREDEADQRAQRRDDEDRRDPEVAREERRAVGRGAVEQRLTEAHDARVAPEEVEAQRDQAQDQRARGEHDPEVVQEERQHEGRGQEHDLEHPDRRRAGGPPPPAQSLVAPRRGAGRRRPPRSC